MILSQKINRCVGVLILTAFSTVSSAQMPVGTGTRLAEATMALVSYAEMSNFAARDVQCKGTFFQAFDTESLVDSEIVPVIDQLSRTSGDARKPGQRAETIAMFKGLARHPNVIAVIPSVYLSKKQEFIVAYGEGGACAALSSMILTVIQQKRLAIREIAQTRAVKK
jgi:hypothetical protein